MANGERAELWEKMLRKPSGNKRPPRGWSVGSGRALKTHAHKVDRRAWSNKLKIVIYNGVKDKEIAGKAFTKKSPERDWMPERAQFCVAVHVTEKRVYFSR